MKINISIIIASICSYYKLFTPKAVHVTQVNVYELFLHFLMNLYTFLSMLYVGGPETEDQARIRFQIELEFVQCLGNPHYLNCKSKVYVLIYLLLHF